MQDELARRLVHDLRGPVAGLDGFLRLLQRDPEDAEAFAMIDQALRATHDLGNQVEDLVRIRQLEDGALTPTRGPVALRALVDGALAALANEAAHRHLTLAVVGDDLELSADPLLLGRALERAIARTVRAAPRRSEVTVTIGRDAAAAVIQIADRGDAIAADQLAALVEPHAGGGRFGLYLPALVVRLHGGAIAAAARADGGTTITLTLPVSV
ncbi:MAG: HAMP domain-containing histidine kinase [Myxococcales bacterium]|nr:HAMP domain-containing histidine kinase [Myxococcales bacterium]